MGNQHAKFCLVEHTPQSPINIKDIKYLALGIGSIRGVALLGAYERLRDMGLAVPAGIAGSSVGCIIGLCIVLGLNEQQMYSFLNQFIGQHFAFKIEQSCNRYSFVDNTQLRSELTRLFSMQDISPAVTFRQLYDKFPIDYRVIVYNLVTKQTETLSSTKTPDAIVLTAVMASSSIPHIFKPEVLQETCYIDGGAGTELPLREFPVSETLGLYLYDAYRSRKVADVFFPSLTNTERDHIISIDVSRVKTTHFNLTADMKEWLIAQGRRAVDVYFSI